MVDGVASEFISSRRNAKPNLLLVSDPAAVCKCACDVIVIIPSFLFPSCFLSSYLCSLFGCCTFAVPSSAFVYHAYIRYCILLIITITYTLRPFVFYSSMTCRYTHLIPSPDHSTVACACLTSCDSTDLVSTDSRLELSRNNLQSACCIPRAKGTRCSCSNTSHPRRSESLSRLFTR